MRTRTSFLLVSITACAVLLACKTDYQQGLEDPHFGLPNSLAGQTQPGPSTDTATAGGTGAAGASAILCVRDGGAEVDAGPCTVSFKTDVLGAFNTAQCAQAGLCHGGTNPPNQPRIDPTDGPGMWNEFAAFKITNGKVYINPCSTDPTQSAIALNVDGTANAADRGTLMPQGSNGLAADVVTKIKTWLICGSPNN